jgi:hypothetical protein
VARYYTEVLDGRIEMVMAQDATGVYAGRIRSVPGAGNEVGMSRYRGPGRVLAKLPEWKDGREVSTTSAEYLDSVRRTERNSYMSTTPSEIMEMAGDADQVIREVLKQADAAVVVFPPLQRSR